MRMRKKKNLLPRMAACAGVQVQQPEELRGAWRARFGAAEDAVLNVEIGCGKGGFILEMARQNPAQLFLAIERVESVLLVAMEKNRRRNWTTFCFFPMMPHGWGRSLPPARWTASI